MKKKFYVFNKKTLVMMIPLVFSLPSFAGTFHVEGYGNGNTALNNLGSYIADLVPNSFTSEFPSNTYGIFVEYGHYRLNEKNICIAVAGLTKRTHSTSIQNSFPYSTFSQIIGSSYSGVMDTTQRKDCIIKAVRGAVSDMMSNQEKLKTDIPHL